MSYKVYLAGEIHSEWRKDLKNKCDEIGLDIDFSSPVTNHSYSDDCGTHILGEEESSFWKDRKGAGINGIRTKNAIAKSDLVVVRFGEKYRQWNAAFDAGYAHALGKPLIIIHPEDYDHALKEVDAAANAVARNEKEVAEILRYVLNGELA